ncbi:MAG: hypothetical protein M5R41_12995 [Bacteroidia bacterium]|nr:hypothetical protein [Bacteroidia bacterium]
MFENIFRRQDASEEAKKPYAGADLYVDAPIAPAQPHRIERSRPVFTGMEDHSISLEEASSLTRNYRQSAANGSVKGKFFSRAAIEQLLAQEDTVGIRYYYGIDAEGKQEMVLVGVNGLGQDLDEGFIFGRPLPISRFHAESNPLNS